MNLLMLLPDGVGVRNFVLGPFLEQANARAQVFALHAIPDDCLGRYRSAWNGSVDWHALIPPRERPVPFVLRSCLAYAQSHWVDSFLMRHLRDRPVKGSWRIRAAIRAARLVGRAAASPRGIRMLDRMHNASARRLPEVEIYRRLYRDIEPSVLFCSHQRPTEILPPVLAARSLGIPTATFIFSWDNITSKGRIAAPFDHFLVWSDHMRQELIRCYPDVAEHRVHVVGTPQFDPYGDDGLLWTREDFYGRIGADLRRPLICYSGGDASVAQDPQHVAVLMEHIRRGRIRGKPQVILRPCPSDAGTRYAKVRHNYPEMMYEPPAWNNSQQADWAKVIPSPEDVQFLANLTYYADVNVNFASTMTLDFAIRGKPVVNVAFDVIEPPPYGQPLWDFVKNIDHYRPVIELGAARFARSPEELAVHLNAYLDDPTLDKHNRQRFVELQVGVPVGQSSREVLDVLHRIAR